MNGNSRKIFRSFLAGSRGVVLAGAHDALSARLVEEAEFDGIWASSYGISLSNHCLPDIDLVTMTETADIVRNMLQAVSIPVIVDCNAGYGNANNVMRTVQKFEDLGAAGICIEDNPFPKRCSLYDGPRHELVSINEMAGRIRAAKGARKDPDFVVIGRVESLIADEGVDLALERCYAYEEAGADALLVHSKSFDLLQMFASRWTSRCTLVAVPTMFNHIDVETLNKMGFKVVIFANQAILVATRSMLEVLRTIRQTGEASSIREKMLSFKEVNRLVRLEQFEQADNHFIAQAKISTIE